MLWIALLVAALSFVALGAIAYFVVREREEELERESAAAAAAAPRVERGPSASSRP